jgi:hypothetical protein
MLVHFRDHGRVLRQKAAHPSPRDRLMEALILAVIGTVLGTVLASEASAWMSHLSRRLVDIAISRLLTKWREEERARWREEIEADFATYSKRPLAGLLFAVGLRWTARKRRLARLSPRRLLDPFRNVLGEMSEEERAMRKEIVYSQLGSWTPEGRLRNFYARRERWRRAELARKRVEAESVKDPEA